MQGKRFRHPQRELGGDHIQKSSMRNEAQRRKLFHPVEFQLCGRVSCATARYHYFVGGASTRRIRVLPLSQSASYAEPHDTALWAGMLLSLVGYLKIYGLCTSIMYCLFVCAKWRSGNQGRRPHCIGDSLRVVDGCASRTPRSCPRH